MSLKCWVHGSLHTHKFRGKEEEEEARRRSLNKNDSLLIVFIVWTFWNAVLFHDDDIFINSITGIFLYGPFAVFSIFRELL